MEYKALTTNSFDDALLYLEALKLKSSASTIEKKKLCILCQKFLEYFVRWLSCCEAEAKAYQVFVRSTPLWPMLELPQSQWISWIERNVSEKISG